MEKRFSRTEMLIGAEGLHRLAHARVMVFGVGGVGGAAVEALSRSGIGSLVIVDYDKVSISNLNRQVVALESTIGQPKVKVMADRILEINPQCNVEVRQEFYEPLQADEFLCGQIDYVIDAIDSVAAKVDLISQCVNRQIPVISAMGAGNKLNPELLQTTDVSATHTCPLARVVRTNLRKCGITQGVKVVFSPEQPIRVSGAVPGSTAFVPPVAGMILASVVIRDLLER